MLLSNKSVSPLTMIKSLFLFFPLIFSVSSQSKDSYFDESEIVTPYVLTHPIFPVNLLENPGNELLTFALDEAGKPCLLVYAKDQQGEYSQAYKTSLPRDFYRFDISSPSQLDQLQNLYFLSSNNVFILNSQLISTQSSFKKVQSISSIAMGDNKQYLTKGDFLTDLNNDNYDDIYLADFNNAHVLIQSEHGFTTSTLPIKVESLFTSQAMEYFHIQPYFEDVNFDGLPDVIYINEGKFTYFLQQQDSSISPIPNYLTVNDMITSLDWWYTLDENGEKPDQSKLHYRKIEQLKDINGDNIMDMVVRFTQSEGVLSKTNDYEIYLGRNIENQLSFLTEADSAIKAEGTLTDIQFVDINNDKKDEILVAGFDIGLSQIIGALLSGSIDQDVHLFYMDENFHFNKNNKVTKEVELNFSLSSGTSGSPVATLLDVNGDNLQDLLLSDDDDTLKIYLGANNKRLFTKRAIKHKTQLPKQGDMLITNDINNDGKDDILIKYGREDKKEVQTTFRVLMSR